MVFSPETNEGGGWTAHRRKTGSFWQCFSVPFFSFRNSGSQKVSFWSSSVFGPFIRLIKIIYQFSSLQQCYRRAGAGHPKAFTLLLATCTPKTCKNVLLLKPSCNNLAQLAACKILLSHSQSRPSGGRGVVLYHSGRGKAASFPLFVPLPYTNHPPFFCVRSMLGWWWGRTATRLIFCQSKAPFFPFTRNLDCPPPESTTAVALKVPFLAWLLTCHCVMPGRQLNGVALASTSSLAVYESGTPIKCFSSCLGLLGLE
jgi:hypothetical protein